jgi:hypothetical protein
MIYSDSFDEHHHHLREVFTRLRNAGLTVNPSKVKFATTQLSFLGHIISSSGVSVDPDRTKSIRDTLAAEQPEKIPGLPVLPPC